MAMARLVPITLAQGCQPARIAADAARAIERARRNL